MQFKSCLVLAIFLSYSLAANSQSTDSTISDTLKKRYVLDWNPPAFKKIFPVTSMLIPAGMLAYGLTGLADDEARGIDKEIKEELWSEHPHRLLHVDNYLQFAPAIAVYGLNLAGIQGRHNLRDRSMLYVLSNLVMNATVFPVKKIAGRLRPDLSDRYSFPSGHTAEAFVSAEFMRQEYKDVSPWYGITGYAMAITTGYLRMYNNKHWLSDVVAGAGIGIASTRVAYWLYPRISHYLFKDKLSKTAVLPGYQNHSVSLSLVHQF